MKKQASGYFLTGFSHGIQPSLRGSNWILIMVFWLLLASPTKIKVGKRHTWWKEQSRRVSIQPFSPFKCRRERCPFHFTLGQWNKFSLQAISTSSTSTFPQVCSKAQSFGMIVMEFTGFKLKSPLIRRVICLKFIVEMNHH